MQDDTGYRQRIENSNAYYEQFAARVDERHKNRDFGRAMAEFTRLADRDKVILDIGCGSGEHLLEFRERGFRCLGVDPSPAMRSLARQKGLDVIDGSFETIDTLPLPAIGGVWAAASLLHVPKEDFPSVIQKIGSILPDKAPLYFTVRLGNEATLDSFDGSGEAVRFIQLYEEDFLLGTLAEKSFGITGHWTEESTWGRPSTWISVVAANARNSAS